MSSLRLNKQQKDHLALLQRPASDVVELCKSGLRLSNQRTPMPAATRRWPRSTRQMPVDREAVQRTVEALISLFDQRNHPAEGGTGVGHGGQFCVMTFPDFIDNVLGAENENRELLEVDDSGRSEQELAPMQEDERRHRKDLLVQTDISSLLYMIKTLEDALSESKTRRIRNIVEGIH
ncbi:GL12601 [Drosophila persimilis]|uniref:GL12601 n=1 Tax=Drosophila persimilis TaxID=7234 RepID=B4GLM8_DROPE|nr:GL12601 [Drosophila persimilis]